MRMNVFTDYCLRTLIYLGLNRDEISTRSEIAASYGISDNHLMKVVHWLSKQNYVSAQRGKGGGIRLSRKPSEINIGELVRASEADSYLVECFEKGNSDCRIVETCHLKFILFEALGAMYATLDRYTLADLITNPNPTRHMLRIVARK